MSNPFTSFVITSTWQDHLNRGNRGGIDYAMPVGTALPAPSAGQLSFIPLNGDAGNTAIITRADGSKTYYMHLSKMTNARTVKDAEIVGYSGGVGPGAGNSTGPHVHTHDTSPDGTRVMPFSTAGGSGATPAPTTPLQAVIAPLTWLSTPRNWVRIGLGAIGVTLVAFVVIKLLSETDVGQAASKAVISAVELAAVVPK